MKKTLALILALMMLLCAALLVVTQFQFGGAQTVLRLRRTRAWEPDFGGGSSFTGPAQALLKTKGNKIQSVSGVRTSSGKASRAALCVAVGASLVAVAVGHVLLDEMAAVAGRVHDDVVALVGDAALEDALERREVVIVRHEGQIVDI